MAAQQAHGAHQLSNKEKSAIDAAVKEAANNIKNAKASQEQLVVVTGVMKNLQPRALSLAKSHEWTGHYLAEPPKSMEESGAFVHEGAASQGNLPVVVGSKAFVIYSPLDKSLPALGWLLAWNKPTQNSEGINQVYVEAGDLGRLLNMKESVAAKDEIFCLFEGALHNLGSLNQHYGLAKTANESVLVIEAYKALRDRAPHPTNHVISHLDGDFSFIVFDKSTSTLFVASDQFGKVPLYWGITSDGYVAFADDANLLKGSCGKSLASFPQGCFFSTAIGELRSYENPKNKITAIPATDEEMWGATFQVEGPVVLAATK